MRGLWYRSNAHFEGANQAYPERNYLVHGRRWRWQKRSVWQNCSSAQRTIPNLQSRWSGSSLLLEWGILWKFKSTDFQSKLSTSICNIGTLWVPRMHRFLEAERLPLEASWMVDVHRQLDEHRAMWPWCPSSTDGKDPKMRPRVAIGLLQSSWLLRYRRRVLQVLGMCGLQGQPQLWILSFV